MRAAIEVYYIGDPAEGNARKDFNGTVHCIIYITIHKENNGYSVWHGGGLVHTAYSLMRARRFIHAYAIDCLNEHVNVAADRIARCNRAKRTLETIGVRGLKLFMERSKPVRKSNRRRA